MFAPLLGIAVLAVGGCTSSGLSSASGFSSVSWPIDPGDAVRLRENEGLLVVHVRSNLPVRAIDLGGVQAAEDVPEGTTVRLIGISAGTYRWTELQLQGDTFRFKDDRLLRFHVDPGVINYVGMIDIERSGPLSLSMNTLDRTAMALEQLRERYPDLVGKYRVVYSGHARHVFLDRYRSSAEKATSGHAR